MDREKILEFLRIQIKKLKEKHVEDLMKHGRVDELKQVAEELDFSTLNEFCDDRDLELQVDEIPIVECFYETIFYFMHSKLDDDKIFKYYTSIIVLAKEKGEELAVKIGEHMDRYDLKEAKIEEIITM